MEGIKKIGGSQRREGQKISTIWLHLTPCQAYKIKIMCLTLLIRIEKYAVMKKRQKDWVWVRNESAEIKKMRGPKKSFGYFY